MKFGSYVAKFQNSNECMKTCHSVVSSNHTFPFALSSKYSVFNWLEKNGYHSDVIDAFTQAWYEFTQKSYATVHGKNMKKKLRKYVD